MIVNEKLLSVIKRCPKSFIKTALCNCAASDSNRTSVPLHIHTVNVLNGFMYKSGKFVFEAPFTNKTR